MITNRVLKAFENGNAAHLAYLAETYYWMSRACESAGNSGDALAYAALGDLAATLLDEVQS